ncbi:MAG: efflux RND transporter periplasmic adaptor subunit [Anaerolineae bacterium]|nr:efflux RND transporter periplasmic adaptor subunit [Anaerolineae bacterium]
MRRLCRSSLLGATSLSCRPMIARSRTVPGGRRFVLLGLPLVFVVFTGLLIGCSGGLDGAVEAALTASGTIRATEVRIATELGGRVAEMPVQLGQAVQAGDVLVQLDPTPWELQLGPAEAGVTVAQADLEALRVGAHPAEIAAAQAAVALAEAERDGAQRALDEALAQVEHPQELETQLVTARTQVALAAQGVAKADSDLRNVQYRCDRQRATDWELRAAQAALAAAQADEHTAKTLLSQLLAIQQKPLGYQAQVNAAEGKLRAAEAGIVVAQAKLEDLLAGPTPEELAVAEAKVRQAEAEANVLRVKVAKCKLVSPINGVVVTKVLRVGELAAPAATILTIADLSDVTLEVYVPENRIGDVQLGQTVRVTVDAYPGRAFSGQVMRIADEPEFTPRNVATAEERLNTFYAVRIFLENPDGALKPGMPADAAF